MKKALTYILLAVIISVAGCILTACGSDSGSITGDWTIKTVNGKSPADFASDNGVYELGTAKNFSFTDNNVTVTAIDETGNIISKTYDIKKNENGLDILASGSTISLEYIEAESQIRYSIKQNDVQYQYVLKKGKTDLESLKTVKAEKGAAPAVTESSDSRSEVV